VKKEEREKINIYIKIMYSKSFLISYTMRSTIAFLIFREAIEKLMHMTFCVCLTLTLDPLELWEVKCQLTGSKVLIQNTLGCKVST
jgi:hypothetical protein